MERQKVGVSCTISVTESVTKELKALKQDAFEKRFKKGFMQVVSFNDREKTGASRE